MEKDQKPRSEEMTDLPQKSVDGAAEESVRGGSSGPTPGPILRKIPNPGTIVPCF